MKTFIDTLDRLTISQARLIQSEARRREIEQQQLAKAEIDRLYEVQQLEEKERVLLERTIARRQETLSMAWLTAEFLKAANVPKQNWIDNEPAYKTIGIFRKRQQLIGQQARYAFEAWELDKLESDLKVLPSFYAAKESSLVLTGDGEIGVAATRQYMEGQPETWRKYLAQSIKLGNHKFILSEKPTSAEAERLEEDYKNSDLLHTTNTLSLLARDGSGSADKLVEDIFAVRTENRVGNLFNGFSLLTTALPERMVEVLYDSAGTIYEGIVEKKKRKFNVDQYIQASLARLLAFNNIKVVG